MIMACKQNIGIEVKEKFNDDWENFVSLGY